MSRQPPATQLPDSFSPSGEKAGMRGRPPQYGKHRTRTENARDFARQLREKSTDAEKRLWRLLGRDRRFSANSSSAANTLAAATFSISTAPRPGWRWNWTAADTAFPTSVPKMKREMNFSCPGGILVLRFWNHQMRGELESIRFEIWHALMKRTGREAEIAGYLPKPPAPSS